MAKRNKTPSIPTNGGPWKLTENGTLRLPRGRFGAVVRVERGSVLVTQEGDVEDHVLETGDEIVLPAGGLAVAWAFTEAAISVRQAPPNGSKVPVGGFPPRTARPRHGLA